MTTLHRYLSNTWMNDPRFLSISAHIWFGCSLVESVHLYAGLGWAWLSMAILGGCAAVKEHFYDANFELPPQTSRDNWEGFFSYLGGAGLGLVISTLTTHTF